MITYVALDIFNFKISPAGLCASQPTKKHSRTVSSCLTCMLFLSLLPFQQRFSSIDQTHAKLMIGQRKKKKCSEEKLVCCRYRRNLSAEPCVRDSLNLRGRVLISCSEIPSASLEVVISSQKSGKYDSLSPTVMWCDTSEDIDVVPRYPMNFDLMKALLKIYQTLLLFHTSNQMLRF